MPAFAKLIEGSITKSTTLKSALGEVAMPGDTRPMSMDQDRREDPRTTASSDPFGLRDGEVVVELPGRFDASLYFIGRKMLFPVVGVIAGLAGIIAAAAGFMAQ